MILLRTSYKYGVFLEYYFKLQFSASWSIHGKALSWENANFRMYLPQENWTFSRKKLNLLPPGKSRTPWKKFNSLGIILIPGENLLKPLEKYQPSPSKKIPIYKKNIIPCKSFNHPE